MSNFVPEKTALGIEFGSTRIKAVLIGPEHTPLAQGDYTCLLYTSPSPRDCS